MRRLKAENEESQYHLIGIGGVGMSALARILLDKNKKVSGSDISPSSVTQNLKNHGAEIFSDHDENHVPSNAVIVYSTDIKEHNPELKHAIEKKLPLLHRSDVLVDLIKDKQTLAIAGTHGKTTTSSLLSAVLEEAQLDPSFAIGGFFFPTDQFGVAINGKYGKGNLFVIEADESDGTFLKYHPFGAIITNAEAEHLNHYQTVENMLAAFEKFSRQVTSNNHLFWCGDDPALVQMLKKGHSYGFKKNCDWQIENFNQKGWTITYDLKNKNKIFKHIQLNLIGKHNALNSTAVFALALELGISEEKIRTAFKNFKGVARRSQKIGEINQLLVLDDYGHHPTEISKTIYAIKQAVEERRLIVLFQPHRYTRTKDCLKEFTHCFDRADFLFITDLYAAREEPIEGISEQSIINHIKQESSLPCRYVASKDLIEVMHDFIRPHDVLLTLGAGNITGFGPQLLDFLKSRPIKKFNVGLIFGGQSVEHEISLISSEFFKKQINQELYQIFSFKIDKQGFWSTDHKKFKEKISSEVLALLLECDIVFPILHGPNGEDGTLQGMLELLNIAYAGPDFRAASISMDKALTKKLVAAAQVPTLPFIELGQLQWQFQSDQILKKINEFEFPLFVKPTHLGSSIGITKVNNVIELQKAIEDAFEFDTHLIIEKGLVNCRELEFAIIGNDSATGFKIDVPFPGEVCSNGMLYDYTKKYGDCPAEVNEIAQVPQNVANQGRQLAFKAYQAVGLSGMARVDFFLDSDGNLWLNEINPIPGFTPNSLFPKIWENQGVSKSELIDRLIILGLCRKRLQKKKKFFLPN